MAKAKPREGGATNQGVSSEAPGREIICKPFAAIVYHGITAWGGKLFRKTKVKETEKMKKSTFLVALLVGLMLLATAASAYTGNAMAKEGDPQVGVLNDRLSTRTGPGTQFEEPGTFLSAGDEITVYSIAYDVNGVAWIQTEINTNAGKMRVYSGLKRVDGLNVDKLHEEGNLNLAATLDYDYAPKYGPGADYASYSFTFRAGRKFTVKDTEGDWAMIEFYAEGDKQWYHLWLPMLYMSF